MTLATTTDAHIEWHRNTGIPVGTPGCPQDACHPVDPWCWDCDDTGIDHRTGEPCDCADLDADPLFACRHGHLACATTANGLCAGEKDYPDDPWTDARDPNWCPPF